MLWFLWRLRIRFNYWNHIKEQTIYIHIGLADTAQNQRNSVSFRSSSWRSGGISYGVSNVYGNLTVKKRAVQTADQTYWLNQPAEKLAFSANWHAVLCSRRRYGTGRSERGPGEDNYSLHWRVGTQPQFSLIYSGGGPAVLEWGVTEQNLSTGETHWSSPRLNWEQASH